MGGGLTCGSRDDAVLLGRRKRRAVEAEAEAEAEAEVEVEVEADSTIGFFSPPKDVHVEKDATMLHPAWCRILRYTRMGLIAALLRSRTVRGLSSASPRPLLGLCLASPLLGLCFSNLSVSSPSSHRSDTNAFLCLWSPSISILSAQDMQILSCFDVKRCFRILLTAIARTTTAIAVSVDNPSAICNNERHLGSSFAYCAQAEWVRQPDVYQHAPAMQLDASHDERL